MVVAVVETVVEMEMEVVVRKRRWQYSGEDAGS
jgi:hypothetical protein